jgi:hypothetical protein
MLLTSIKKFIDLNKIHNRRKKEAEERRRKKSFVILLRQKDGKGLP